MCFDVFPKEKDIVIEGSINESFLLSVLLTTIRSDRDKELKKVKTDRIEVVPRPHDFIQ